MNVARVGLVITILLYTALLAFLLAHTVHAEQKKVLIPSDVLTYRVDQLERWRDERDSDHLPQRVQSLEEINKLDRDNRTLLWGLLGTAGLNILSTAFLGFITTRKSRS
jgi:hypothetical protein